MLIRLGGMSFLMSMPLCTVAMYWQVSIPMLLQKVPQNNTVRKQDARLERTSDDATPVLKRSKKCSNLVALVEKISPRR